MLDCFASVGNHLWVPLDIGVTHAADLMPGEYLRNRLGSPAFDGSRRSGVEPFAVVCAGCSKILDAPGNPVAAIVSSVASMRVHHFFPPK